MLFKLLKLLLSYVESEKDLLSNTLDSDKFPFTQLSTSPFSTSAIWLGGIPNIVCFSGSWHVICIKKVNTPLGGLCAIHISSAWPMEGQGISDPRWFAQLFDTPTVDCCPCVIRNFNEMGHYLIWEMQGDSGLEFINIGISFCTTVRTLLTRLEPKRRFGKLD